LNFTSDTIDKFVSNAFEIDCFNISLTQKKENEPIVYSGPGTIYQDNHGILRLKFYSKILDVKKELSNQFKYNPPGKILTDDNYYTLKAVDMTGKEWVSDNIMVSPDMSLPVGGQVVKSSLSEIETIGEGATTEQNHLLIIVPGKYEIPCNEKEDLPNGGWRLSRSVFSANNVDFDLKDHENCLIINANSTPEYIEADSIKKILEALSVITGLIIKPVVIKYTQQGRSVLKIKSVSDTYSNKKFPKPFNHSTPADIQSFSCFLGKYMAAIDAPFSDLYGFWHKVNRAWQANCVFH